MKRRTDLDNKSHALADALRARGWTEHHRSIREWNVYSTPKGNDIAAVLHDNTTNTFEVWMTD